MRSAQGRGPTLDEAVDAALIELGESRRNVDVRVVSEGPEETVVEVTVGVAEEPATATAQPSDPVAEHAREMVSDLLTKMGIRASVAVRAAEVDGPIQLDVTGRDLGLLIGWRGETLRALQAVSNMLVGRELGERRVIVDVERYRQRREHTVREIALRAARQVKMTGDPITLDAMQPFERRAIHLALEADPSVLTNSIGEEPNRRVVVSPRAGES